MLADQFQAAADRARTLAQLEDVSRLLWRANAEGHVDDAAAGAISEAVAARRARFKAGRPPPLPSPARPAVGRPGRPIAPRSIERRRRQAASGAMPPALAANFTTGEGAALAVIAREVQRGRAVRVSSSTRSAPWPAFAARRRRAPCTRPPPWLAASDRAAAARGARA